MPLATPSAKATFSRRPNRRNVVAPDGSHYAVEEINAYIAVRDSLLEEAEQNVGETAIERLLLANNFVANCLSAVRQPYIMQCLPEADALRELTRCRNVDRLIAKLRARLVNAA